MTGPAREAPAHDLPAVATDEHPLTCAYYFSFAADADDLCDCGLRARREQAASEHVEPTTPSRLPTPEEMALALFAGSGMTEESVSMVGAAAIAITKDRAAILARFDEIAELGAVGDPRAATERDRLRAELRGAS